MVQSKKEGEKVTQTADNSKFIARIILNGQILLGSKSFFLAWKVAEIMQQGNKLSPNVGTIVGDGPAITQITIYFDDEFDSWLDSSDCFPALSQLQTDEGNTSKYDARIMLKGPILPPSKTHAIALKVAESMKQSNKRNKLSPHVDVVVCQDETEITIYFDKPADSSNRSTAPSQLQTGACNTSVTAQEQPDSNDQSNQETTNASVAAESDLLTEDSEGSTSTGSEEANNPAEIAKDYEFAFDFDYLAREFAFDFDYSAREFGLEIDLSALDEPNNSNRYTVPSQLQTDAGNTSKSNTQPKLHMPEPSTGSLTEQEQPDSNEQSNQEITNASVAVESGQESDLLTEDSSADSEEANDPAEAAKKDGEEECALDLNSRSESLDKNALSQSQTGTDNTSESDTRPKLHMPEPSTDSLTALEQPDSNDQSNQETTNASVAAESDLLTEDFSEDSEEANDPAEAAKEDDELTFTYTAPVSNSYIFRELYNWRPIRKFDTSFFGYTPPSRYILKHQGPTAVYSSLALASTFIPYKDMSPIVKKCNANRLIELGSKYALDAIRGIFNFDQDQEQWLKVSDLAKALRADGPSQYNKSPISSIINTPILTPYDIVNKVLDNKLPWSFISGETAKGIGYFSAANVIAYKHYTKTLGDHAYPYNIGNPDHWEHPDLLVNNDNDHCDCGSIIRTALLDNTPIVDALSLPNIVHNNVTMPFVKYCQINGCRILELNGKFGFKYGITSEQICEFMDNAVNVINIGNDISALNEFLCISTFVHYICIYEQLISHYQSK